jgi:hypothetical protein
VTVYAYLYNDGITTTNVTEPIVYPGILTGKPFSRTAATIPGYTLVTSTGATPAPASQEIASVALGTADKIIFYYQKNPAAAFVTTLPVASNIYKGDALSASALSGGVVESSDGEVSGSFAWVSPSAVLNTAGTNGQNAAFTADIGSYNIADRSVNVTVLDKDALDEIIETAETTISNAAIGTAIGEYAQEDATLFAEAIAAAKSVADKAAKDNTQAAINSAKSTLEAAAKTFADAVITDTGSPEDPGTPPADPGTPPADPGTPPSDPGTPPTDTDAPPKDQTPQGTAPNVTAIRVAVSSLYITKGKTLDLKSNVVIDGEQDTLTYTSGNPAVVSVTGSKIKGLKVGSATIKIAATNGRSASVKVTVGKKAVKLKKFTLTGIKKNKLSLKVGKTKALKIKLAQKKASDLKISFKSSKKAVASIDAAGKITALKKGNTVITVKVGSKSVKVKLTVKK